MMTQEFFSSEESEKTTEKNDCVLFTSLIGTPTAVLVKVMMPLGEAIIGLESATIDTGSTKGLISNCQKGRSKNRKSTY
jgi:hypothetical protein